MKKPVRSTLCAVVGGVCSLLVVAAGTHHLSAGTGVPSATDDPNLHLFVDDHGLKWRRHLVRTLGRPRRLPEPVVAPTKPWEGPRVVAWGSVIRRPTDGLFQMWYTCFFPGGIPQPGAHGEMCLLAYAESTDGVRWEKPNLGIYAWGGDKQTNIVLATTGHHNPGERLTAELFKKYRCEHLSDGPRYEQHIYHFDAPNVVWDAQEQDPKKRYKLFSCMWTRAHSSHAHYLMTSPDGIRWSYPPEKVLEGYNDGTTLGWDPLRRRWMLTTLNSGYLESGENVRRQRLLESDDLRHWEGGYTAIELDERDGKGAIMQSHYLRPFAYGDQYLGFNNMIHSKEGWAEAFLVTSRDGRNFEREFRDRPWLGRGPEGSFDEDLINMVLNAPILVGDDLYIYYTGRSFSPPETGGAIGLLTVKRDRFAGLCNGSAFSYGAGGPVSSNYGELLTHPVKVTGPRLYVNVRCSSGYKEGEFRGSMKVELCDENDKPIPGYTAEDCSLIQTDALRHAVTWRTKKDVHELIGRKVGVRMQVRIATVYSYVFAD